MYEKKKGEKYSSDERQILKRSSPAEIPSNGLTPGQYTLKAAQGNIEMDKKKQKTRKLIFSHKALRPRYDIERWWVKKGRKRISSIEDCRDTSIQGFEVYIKELQRKTNYSSQ